MLDPKEAAKEYGQILQDHAGDGGLEGGPHAIPWTHADQVNSSLRKFLS